MTPTDETDLELIPSAVAPVSDSLDLLLSSPWFRSNYTLREIILCDNVTILNREGNTVPIRTNGQRPAVIDTVATACTIMLAWLQRMQQRTSIPAKSIGLTIQCVKLVQANGPFFLYSSLPDILHHYTQQLLTTGVLLIQGKAGEEVHDGCWETIGHGWGECYRIACTCAEVCSCPPSVPRNFETYEKDEATWPLGYGKHGHAPPVRKKTCIPCILNISYKVGDTAVDSHTPFKEPLRT